MSRLTASRSVVDRRDVIFGMLLHPLRVMRPACVSLLSEWSQVVFEPDQFVSRAGVLPSVGWLSAEPIEDLKVAVQTIGGACPTWVGPSAPSLPSAFELIIFRQPGFISDGAGVEPSRRVAIIDASLSVASLPSCAFAISGVSAELDILAEALARTVALPSIIGIDFADIENAASFRAKGLVQDAKSPPRGRGFVLDAVRPSASSGAAVKDCLIGLELAGFSGGVFIALLIGPASTACLPDRLTILLYELDAFVTAVGTSDDYRPYAISAVPGASRDTIVVVAFGGASADC